MPVESKGENAVLDLPQKPDDSSQFASLAHGATLEFFSAMQLLAERGRFVTGAVGVSIAVREGNQYVYCACSGLSAAETGTPANITKHLVADSISGKRQALANSDPANHE